jgi:uncharacterized coiled-coil protein SlyX
MTGPGDAVRRMTLEERNEALAEQVAEMALMIKDLKKSLKFKELIIESLKFDLAEHLKEKDRADE